MLRRKILVAAFAGVVSMAIAPMPFAAAATDAAAKPCATVSVSIVPRHIHLGEGFGGELGVQNCAPDTEWLTISWRMNGPCHPHWGESARIRLHRNEGLIASFEFLSPPCVGQYRFTAKVLHGSRLLGRDVRFLRVSP